MTQHTIQSFPRSCRLFFTSPPFVVSTFLQRAECWLAARRSVSWKQRFSIGGHLGARCQRPTKQYSRNQRGPQNRVAWPVSLSLSSLSRKSLCYFSSRLTPSAQSAGRKHKEISVYAFVKMRFYWLIASAPFVCEHLHVAKYVMQEECKLATKMCARGWKLAFCICAGTPSFWGGCMRSTTFTFVFLECAGVRRHNSAWCAAPAQGKFILKALAKEIASQLVQCIDQNRTKILWKQKSSPLTPLITYKTRNIHLICLR